MFVVFVCLPKIFQAKPIQVKGYTRQIKLISIFQKTATDNDAGNSSALTTALAMGIRGESSSYFSKVMIFDYDRRIPSVKLNQGQD
jgi:hypothetical protein